MKNKIKKNIINYLKIIINSILNSYSQIFFSNNKIFACILLIVSFFDIYAGACGLISVIVSNMIALMLGFSKENIKKGLYGFNSLLVGLGVGAYFQTTLELYVIVFLLAILTLFLSLILEGVFTKYGIPYLSIPFVFVMWAIVLSSREFSLLGMSTRGIYTLNEIYAIGGKKFVDYYIFIGSINVPKLLEVYFLSLGAIFFQYNVIAGIFISIGLLIYSRIAFSLSLIGFCSAVLFYQVFGVDISTLSSSYIGFNFILTAIAVGGFFTIPSYSTYLWTVFLLPIVVMVSISFEQILDIYQLSFYSLPFNVVTIMFIYVLKLRVFPSKRIVNNFMQHNSPEKNLYNYKNNINRFKDLQYFPISLPFWGKWLVSQAHNGKYTHKEDWKHAWDFIIEDEDGKQFKNNGYYVTDYYCYNKSVISPAAGIVQEIADNVLDNAIGDINLEQNWGNSIVIKHTEYLYSQISHIKKGTFKVVKGQYVNKGQILALCGNSGHSPFPHLHFQLQKTPFIGSKTINYPINNFIVEKDKKFDYNFYKIPKLDQQLSNIQTNYLIKKTLNFIPGQKLEAELIENSSFKKQKSKILDWKVEVDIYKNTYIRCDKTNSFAYFKNDGSVFQFNNFVGNKNSLLYYFYLSMQKVQLGYYNNIQISDVMPIELMFSKLSLFFQDFIAPFYIYLQTKYKLHYKNIDGDLAPSEIKLYSTVNNNYFGKTFSKLEFFINLFKDKIKLKFNGNTMEVRLK